MGRHNVRWSEKDGLASGQSTDSISADWTYWKQVPVVKVFEAVYLSVSMNPAVANIRTEEYPYLAARGTEKAKKIINKINEKLTITKAHIKAESFNVVRYWPGEGGLYSEVLLSEFGRWANDIGWELPEDFPVQSAVPVKKNDIETPESELTREELILNEVKRRCYPEVVGQAILIPTGEKASIQRYFENKHGWSKSVFDKLWQSPFIKKLVKSEHTTV